MLLYRDTGIPEAKLKEAVGFSKVKLSVAYGWDIHSSESTDSNLESASWI